MPPLPATQADARAVAPTTLIGGAYEIGFGQPLPAAAGGPAAFAVTDHRQGRLDLMAVQVPEATTPRSEAIEALSIMPVGGMLVPFAQGAAAAADGKPAWFVICRAPTGASLAAEMAARPGEDAPRPWSDAELFDCVLRPAALALADLASRRLTHRAIRLDNLFRAGPGQPVELGCAWVEPPAFRQPAVFEPPYSAMCLPAGRGDGTIADDVYSLGVVLLALALGRVPLADLDREALVLRTLEQGSFRALTDQARLSPELSDLLRGMLADDPQHRPPPTLLVDPLAAGARRVVARPLRRAQQPLQVGNVTVWNARVLAFAICRQPTAGARLLRTREAEAWLRRYLGDIGLAQRVDELVRQRGGEALGEDAGADALLCLRATALLDPLAPLCWNGFAFWPKGLGPLLASPPPDGSFEDHLQELLLRNGIFQWLAFRPDQRTAAEIWHKAAQAAGMAGRHGIHIALLWLRYLLNPALPCRSPLLTGFWVTQPAELARALEAVAARGEGQDRAPVDEEIKAFLAARGPQSIDLRPPSPEGSGGAADALGVGDLRLLARLQASAATGPLPNLAAWTLAHFGPAVEPWHSRNHQAAADARAAEAARQGDLGKLLTAWADPVARAQDREGRSRAVAEIQHLEGKIAAIDAAEAARARTARQIGAELAAGIGLMALTVAAIAAAFP